MLPLPHLHKFLPRRKLTIALLVPCVVVLLLASLVIVWLQLQASRQDFAQDLTAAADIVANNVTAAITFKDEAAAMEVLGALRAKEQVIGAVLVTPNNPRFASYGHPPADPALTVMAPFAGVVFKGSGVLVSCPVVLDGRSIATLHVLSDYHSVYLRVIKMILWMFALMVVACAAVAAVLSNRLQRFVSEPILRLTAAARQVADQGDYSVRVPEEEGDEFGVLTRAFNKMLGQIQTQALALKTASQRLAEQVQEMRVEIAEREKAERKLAQVHEQLMTASRQAGMADVATGVLHNVGNVLNSVNVSGHLINDRLRNSRTGNLARTTALLKSQGDEVGEFLSRDPKGKLVPGYLAELSAHLEEERTQLAQEAELLLKNIVHIKEIVAMHQSYARVAGVVEDLAVAELVEDALRLQAGAFDRHGVEVRREYEPAPLVRVDKHKVLQILVNLLRNAKYALDAVKETRKVLTVRVAKNGGQNVRVVVQDNGEGIPPENLTRIFQHGFTTKPNGHGVGLHNSALCARELGGSLQVASDGPGQGATFTLELPIATSRAKEP